jgi:hypothetical protein
MSHVLLGRSFAVLITAAAVCAGLALAAASKASATYESYGVTTQDGQHLTPEAENFAKSYDQAIQEEWFVDGVDAAEDALSDEKWWRKGLVGRMLPLAGRVVPIAGGAYGLYEVCSAFLEEGCWVFGRDDTDLDFEDDLGTPYHAYHVDWVDSEGRLEGVTGGWSYPDLAGMRDIFIGEPVGTSTPVVLRSNLPQLPPGATTACGVDYGGPAGFSEVNTAETALCMYKLDGVRHYFDIPRSKWWASASPDLLQPQTDDPTIPNADVQVPADPNWADELAEELARNDRARKEIGHLMDPGGVDPPYPPGNRHPECEPTPAQGDPLPGEGADPKNAANWNVIAGPLPVSDGPDTNLNQGYTYRRADGDWGGWGYRKIAAMHGWGPTDLFQTSQALINPAATKDLGGGSKEFTGPTFSLNGHLCVRRVVVRFSQSYPNRPPRGIINSYGRPAPSP